MNDGDNRGPSWSRRRILTAGVAVAGAGLAGCLGGRDEDTIPVASADPMRSPVGRVAVSWDDLGDLEGELTVYSGRTRDQIDPVFTALEDAYEDFTISVAYGDNDETVNQLMQEGDATPADLMYSQDPGALGALVDNDLVQALPEDVIEAVPSSFRHPDGRWTGVTGRVRSVQYHSERWSETADDFPTNILDFATDERFQGIIATRPNSGSFRGFVQAMVELEGETTTREWLRAMVDDKDIQLFSSGSTMAEAVNRGGDDDPIVALGNSYYAARILNEDPDAPIRVTFTENDAGCLFSVAGVAVLNSVSDASLVAEFVRHLLAEEGQRFMMEANGEYPVVEGVDYIGPLPAFEELNPPTFDLSSFDMDLQAAGDLLTEEGMTV